jgi:ankyrin repeat protein
MALHRGRIDLLEQHLARDPGLLARRFSSAAIYPAEVGCEPDAGLHVTPVDGATLLHLAMEYDELEIARWLLDRGADPNARSGSDAGPTPLFHAVATLGSRDDAKARLLLERGADPNARATFTKQLHHMGDPERERPRTFLDVTPLAYAAQFQEPRWVSEPALTAVRAAGGTA